MKQEKVGFIKKLSERIKNPKAEKVLIIAAPCAALLITALILVPSVNRMVDQMEQRPVSQAAAVPAVGEPGIAVVVTPGPGEEPAPSPSVQPSPSEIHTNLRASSTEKDLYITVYDDAGHPVTGENFSLTVGYPDGQAYSFDTETDGSCYLVRLEAGEYSIRMNEHEGYTMATPITCQVKAKLSYEHIDNIDDYVDVKDVTDVPQDQVKTQDSYDAPNEAVADEIVTPGGAAGGTVTEQYPILDAKGNQVYTYTYDVGEHGYLLYRATGEESNVEPVDEDGDGQIDFGQYFYVPDAPEDGSQPGPGSNGYYRVEVLFNPDNTPVDTYAIYATPVMGSSSRFVGWREINGSLYYYDSDGNMVTGLKKIDGRIYYFDKYGARASSVGIDVSYYDGNINWQAVKAQGIDFAIIRVGGRTWQAGTIYYDSRTVEYFTEAKRAGLKVGAYFYSTAISPLEAVQEATVTLDVLNGVSLDFPVYFDTEYSGMAPKGRADNLDKTQRTEIIKAFCETITNSSKYAVGVYSGEYFMKNNLDYSSISQYNIWLASYTSNNNLPNFSGRYDMWQFSDRGVIDGITGYVDMNVIF